MSDSAKKLPKKRKVVVQAGPIGAPPPVNVLALCQKVFAPAKSFNELVSLVRDAERRLIAAGMKDIPTRVTAIRSLYYGSDWSLDFEVEKNEMRNHGFRLFAGLEGADPTPFLDCNLYQALQGSQDAVDGGRHFDFGHLIIGADAREKGRYQYGVPSMGTGLEASTWLGDLGGGAAMLAMSRATAPSTPAITRFRGSDYGGSINLEGDVGGYVIADAGGSKVGKPYWPQGGVAQALNDYINPANWTKRVDRFMTMYESEFGVANLVDGFASKIEDFAVAYMIQRIVPDKSTRARAKLASYHVRGAARECAHLFVDTLTHSRSSGARIEAVGPGPAVTPPGDSIMSLDMALAAADLF
jgi:hypothetical protein